MPGWSAFKAEILLGQTEDWSKVTVLYDFAVTGVLVTATVKDASTGATIQALLTAASKDFSAGSERTLAELGAPPWTPTLANKNAFLDLVCTGGTPAVASTETIIPCPVIDFPDVGNVREADTVDGVDGTLANLAPTDAAYAALEATRNTVVTPLSAVPSPANGGPAAWTQLGASKVGTGDKIYSAADEASRNVDPGVAHVEDGVDYKIHNVDLEGTFAGGGPVTYPNAPDITVARLTDTSARVTVDGDAGVTNYVLYAPWADGGNTWLAWGNRSGDGNVDKTGLTSGQTYLICAYSQDATGGRAFSNVKVFTAGPAASTASGAYTKFLADLYAAVLNSATLAAAVSGNLTDHVRRGRFLHTDAAPLATTLTSGPVVYVRYVPYALEPRTHESSRGNFTAELEVVQAFDQSVSDDLTAPSNFVEALKREIMSGIEGAGSLWSTNAFAIHANIGEPQVIAKDTLLTAVKIAAGYVEGI